MVFDFYFDGVTVKTGNSPPSSQRETKWLLISLKLPKSKLFRETRWLFHKIQKVATKFVLTAFNSQLFIIVRNRLPPLSIAPRTARFIGYIVRNKETFLLQIKILFCSYSDCVVYTKTILFTSVSVKVEDIYLAASWLGKYPPLFTSTSVNNC